MDILDVIQKLDSRIASTDYKKYKKEHPKTKKTPSDPLFKIQEGIHPNAHQLIPETDALHKYIHSSVNTYGGHTAVDKEGKPIGVVSLHPTTIEHGHRSDPSHTHAIVQMSVDPNHRGKGIGEKLLKEAKKSAKEHGFKKLIGYNNHSPGFKHLADKHKITDIDDVDWNKVAPYENYNWGTTNFKPQKVKWEKKPT